MPDDVPFDLDLPSRPVTRLRFRVRARLAAVARDTSRAGDYDVDATVELDRASLLGMLHKAAWNRTQATGYGPCTLVIQSVTPAGDDPAG